MRIQPLGIHGVQRRVQEIESKLSTMFGSALNAAIEINSSAITSLPSQTIWRDNFPQGNPLAMSSPSHIPLAIGAGALAPLNPLDLIPSNQGVGLSELRAMADQVAGEFGLDVALFRALINAESSWNPNSVSPKGAQGLTQLMPDTARELGVIDPFDPRDNLRGGAKYLKQMIDQFGQLELALAAYNAGPGAVRRHNGIPPYIETQNYVRKIMQELSR
ncbi:MAG: lytic transglycosylase domain-containing protein [Fimbriimonadales bacterium]|nr:lytic transglycosylase domain-containing protein [Fimbriimonadales bacterium]